MVDDEKEEDEMKNIIFDNNIRIQKSNQVRGRGFNKLFAGQLQDNYITTTTKQTLTTSE